MYYIGILTLFYSSKLHTLKNEPPGLVTKFIVIFSMGFLWSIILIWICEGLYIYYPVWFIWLRLLLQIEANHSNPQGSDWHFHYTCNIDILLLLPLSIWYTYKTLLCNDLLTSKSLFSNAHWDFLTKFLSLHYYTSWGMSWVSREEDKLKEI